MANPQGTAGVNDRIMPGGQIPFMIIWAFEPPSADKTFVSVADAERPALLRYGLFGALLIAGGMTLGGLRPWQSAQPIAASPLETLPRPPVSVPLPAAATKSWFFVPAYAIAL